MHRPHPCLRTFLPGLGREPYGYDSRTGEPAKWRDQGEVSAAKFRTGESEELYFRVPVRNVGNGVALVHEVRMILSGKTRFVGSSRNPALPPDERTQVTMSIMPDKSSWAEAEMALSERSPFYRDRRVRRRGEQPAGGATPRRA